MNTSRGFLRWMSIRLLRELYEEKKRLDAIIANLEKRLRPPLPGPKSAVEGRA